jgi:fructokinase
MGKLFSIGEVLIDFIPLQKGEPLKHVVSFERSPGGAPANVAAAVAKYGKPAAMITKVGEDAFGQFLIEQLAGAGVETDKILRTNDANTGLAFVSLQENGERDFSFYRKPSADLLLTEEEIDPHWFGRGDILHFCSVDLVESPMKQAHLKAIEAVISRGGVISFDPNVRLPLWETPEDCRKAILAFLPYAHLVKVSDEELPFITGKEAVEEAVRSLLCGNVQAVVYTKGADGADIYTRDTVYKSSGYRVEVQDTTGAGDAFIGGLLTKMLEKQVNQQNILSILDEHHKEILAFANASGALTTTGKGSINSIPTLKQISDFLK